MWRRTWLVFSQAVTVAVAALFVVVTLKPQWLPGGGGGSVLLAGPTLVQATADPAGAPSGAAGGYAAAARRPAPAVVAISATK
ncbi:MAG: 2-alkenal reductase, partial [Betaproteobacteria bacterium]